MAEPGQPLTPQEEAYLLAQTQAQQAAATQATNPLDSGMFMNAEADIESSRQFYLGYDDELNELVQSWRGFKKNGETGKWTKDKNATPVMGEEAISHIRVMLNTFLMRAVRLGNYEPKMVNLYAYQARKHVSKWLHMDGWLKYGVSLSNLNPVSFQCGQLVHASLSWAQNGGGRHFMTTASRTIENLSLVGSPGQQVTPGGRQTGAGGGRMKNMFKKLPTPW